MAVHLDNGRFEAGQSPVDRGPDKRIRTERQVIVADPRRNETPSDARSPSSPSHARFASVAYAALRIATGVILAAHGFVKLMDFPAWAETVRSLRIFGAAVPLPTLMAALATLVEFGGGIALVLGLLTRLVSFSVLVTMLVGILTVHVGHGLFSKDGGFEFPLLVLMVSALFLADGSGRYGLDAKLFSAVKQRREAKRQRRTDTGPRYAH